MVKNWIKIKIIKMKLTIIAALLVSNISAVQIESQISLGRRIHRSQLVSIAEALRETGEGEGAPAEVKKPEAAVEEGDAKKGGKPEVEEEKKAAVKESKNDSNERDEDKAELTRPVKEKEVEPDQVVEEKPAEKTTKKGKKATKAAVGITDTHDRKNPVKRIREWTNAYAGQTLDCDEHYPVDTSRYLNKNFDEPKVSSNSTEEAEPQKEATPAKEEKAEAK